MTQKALFESLGAPLKNVRWSWGAVRPKDGAIFLRVWEDRVRTHEGSLIVQITHAQETKPANPGHRERMEHVARIQQGARTYLVMCEAADVKERPRRVQRFNSKEVFPGGSIVRLDGEEWIEMLPGLAVKTVA